MIFLSLTSCGLAGSCLGFSTMRVALQLADSLRGSRCESGKAAALEAATDRIADFRRNCNHQGVLPPLELCPGFDLAFPAPRQMEEYSRTLERDFACSGFCHNLPPVWAPHALRPEACALALQQRLRLVSISVGLPCFLAGALLALGGLALYNYEEI